MQNEVLPPLDQAFDHVDRGAFVAPELRQFAYADRPLPIGHNQTISQPSTVRRMLGWPDARPGQTILDVGSGSGWTSALLGYIAGPSGHIYAVDIVDELVAMGKNNCEHAGIQNVTFSRADPAGGLAAHAPYDRILVSASGSEIPSSLRSQLAAGGTIVMPIGESIIVATRTATGWDEKRHAGYLFVPYVSQA